MTDKPSLSDRLKQKMVPPKEVPRIFRLPPGTEKVSVWDGKKWTVTMKVPGLTPFFSVGPSEITTLHHVQRKYEQFMAKKNACGGGKEGVKNTSGQAPG